MSTLIVGIGGSLSPTSTGRRALALALEAAAAAGARTELIDVASLALPLYDPSIEPPAAARRLARAAARADAMIWSSPTYHGTISGAFKNTLDWLELLGGENPPYLTNKPVGMVATAAGTRGIQTVHSMALVAQALRAWTHPLSVTIGRAYAVFEADGTLRDTAARDQLESLGRHIAETAHRFKTSAPLAPAPTA